MSLAIGSWLNKNSQRWYFSWENLQEVFVILVVVGFHLLLFFIHCCFYISGLLIPCHLHSALASQAREGLNQLWALPWPLSIAFAFATVLSGHFLPTGIFYLILLPHICWYNLLLSRLPWEPVVLPWSLQDIMLILETQIRPICLSDSHQSTTLIFERIRF